MNNNRLLLFIVAAVGALALLVTGAYLLWQMLIFPSESTAVTNTEATSASVADSVAGSASDSVAAGEVISTEASVVAESGESAESSSQADGLSASTTVTFVEAAGMAPVTLNPVYATDAAAQTIIDKIYPRLLGQEPAGGFMVPSALAESWQISPDGRVYTFTLRDGVRWSDGEPVTAADFKFTYEALASPLVQSPYRDRTVGIARIDAPDPRTVVVTLAGPNCSVLHSLRQPLLPSHHFAADFSDLETNPLNQEPTVSAGPFHYTGEIEDELDGEKITLARNPDFWQGAPQIANWEVQVISDPVARRLALAEGKVDLAHFDADEVVDVPLELDSTVTVSYLPTDGYSFLALNLADPATPQAGRASDGTSVIQTPHPILGELAVRQAIAASIDYDRIIDEVYHGHAERTASYVPAIVNWAYDDQLPLPTYDPVQADQLLTAAGWVDDDGDGIRTRAEVPLALSIRTNDDNPKRVAMARLIAEQLTALGFQVGVGEVGFDELTADLLDQRYDMVVIGWENLGADPGNSPFWHSQADIPGTGFNFSSFHDDEVDGWLESATKLEGCDLDSRGELYRQVQQRIAGQLPYIFLAAQENAWAYQSQWQGIAPGPWGIEYNVASWRLP